jgi:hypothetical protein
MNEPPSLSPEVIASMEDPWIQGYLRLRQAVVDETLTTMSEIREYARELRAGMPTASPSPLIAAFIAADIAITFPVLRDVLWTP